MGSLCEGVTCFDFTTIVLAGRLDQLDVQWELGVPGVEDVTADLDYSTLGGQKKHRPIQTSPLKHQDQARCAQVAKVLTAAWCCGPASVPLVNSWSPALMMFWLAMEERGGCREYCLLWVRLEWKRGNPDD